MIPTEDFTDVTLASEDTDDYDDYGDNAPQYNNYDHDEHGWNEKGRVGWKLMTLNENGWQWKKIDKVW